MKTIIMALFLSWPIIANAADYSLVKTGGSDESVILSVEEAGLTYNRNYFINPDTYRANRMAVAVTYTSTTYSNVAFSTNAITMGSANISKTSHGLTLGLPVLLRQTAGTVPGPLVAETTYYAINYTANIIQLATTSAQAISNDPIVLVSSSNTGTQTYTLIPLSIGGTPSMKWQASNDGTYWSDVNTSSVTVSAYTAGGVTSSWDFEETSFSNYKLAVISPTTGGLFLKIVANIKQN